jgi:uncharacterized protein
MKYIEIENPVEIPGKLLSPGEKFSSACHPGVSCFNQCCRNLNLFLYPYDIIRLKKILKITTDAVIDRHTDLVLRENSYFPNVLLRMADNEEKTCPFLSSQGCTVYPDRPQTCRAFPVEQGLYFKDEKTPPELLSYFRPPDFCMGGRESTSWTAKSWEADQNAAFYNQMTLEWADILRLFQADPFNGAGPYSPKGKMAFMAAYNMDAFRDFIFNSSFLKRYTIKSQLRLKIKTDDVALLRLGFSWIRLFVFGIHTGDIGIKK